MFLLDSNVISELRKPEHRGNPLVRSWVGQRTPAELFLSVITILEIGIGISRLERSDRAQTQPLRLWLEEALLTSFERRILPVDLSVARRAARMHVPDPRPERDALIAATAAEHGLTMVTRSVLDIAPLGVPVIDPWLSG